MRVFKVTDALAPKYRGTGYALAAIAGGQLVDIRYLRDFGQFEIIDQIEDSGPHAGFFFKQWLNTSDAAPTVRELQAIGEVSAGILSAWEFCEL